MLPLTVKGNEATFSVTLMFADTQFRKRHMEGICDSPYPPNYSPHQGKSNGLDRKLLRRMLKRCDKDTDVSSPLLMASGGGIGRKGLSSV